MRSSAAVKYTPGERTSWDTTTRSVPLTMKVPSVVIMAKSPMKTSASLISPAFSPVLMCSRVLIRSGAEKVMSRWRHSSSSNLGAPNS